jgi:3-methyladenine DNA glycosylase AlkC
MSHPIHRFQAPSHIMAGSCMADLLGPSTIKLIAESFAPHSPDLHVGSFVDEATDAIDGLGIKPRSKAIAAVLRRHLPDEDGAALSALIASLGPPLARTEDNGLQPLFYMPHGFLLQGFAHTADDAIFASGLAANLELTCRFTAEFSIRPYIEVRFAQTLTWLRAQTEHTDPHVRRLVSEGTRPRLPWATHLTTIRTNPRHSLALLEALKDDPCRYVTRSVANHLGDIGKDHPDVLFATCRRWLEDPPSDPVVAKERHWLIRHALRHPAKHKVPEALSLRARAR